MLYFKSHKKRFPDSTVSPHWMVTPLIIRAHLSHRFLHLVKASERQRGDQKIGWLQKSFITLYILFDICTVKIYDHSFKYAYLWVKHTFDDVEGKHVLNCMLSGRNVPKMMMDF